MVWDPNLTRKILWWSPYFFRQFFLCCRFIFWHLVAALRIACYRHHRLLCHPLKKSPLPGLFLSPVPLCSPCSHGNGILQVAVPSWSSGSSWLSALSRSSMLSRSLHPAGRRCSPGRCTLATVLDCGTNLFTVLCTPYLSCLCLCLYPCLHRSCAGVSVGLWRSSFICRLSSGATSFLVLVWFLQVWIVFVL